MRIRSMLRTLDKFALSRARGSRDLLPLRRRGGAGGFGDHLPELDGRQLLNTRIPHGRPCRACSRSRQVDIAPANLGAHSFAIQVAVRGDGKVIGFAL
jgi:hypothetical protein